LFVVKAVWTHPFANALEMTRLSLFVAASALLASIAEASTLTPPVLPLIVRNPYLSTWLGGARDEPWKNWPMFYTGQEVRPLLARYVHAKTRAWSIGIETVAEYPM